MNKNSEMKNIFLYLRDIYKLKSKTVYNYVNYEKNINLKKFYTNYSDIVKISEFDETFEKNNNSFILNYIRDEKKLKIPSIPKGLEKVLSIRDEDVMYLIDDYEFIIKEEELIDIHKDYLKEIERISIFNKKIDDYNELYRIVYEYCKRIVDSEEKFEYIIGLGLFIYKDYNEENKEELLKRHIFEVGLDFELNPLENTIKFTVSKERKFGVTTDFLNFKGLKVKDSNALYEIIDKYNANFIDGNFKLADLAKDYLNATTYNNEYIDELFENSRDNDKKKAYIFNDTSLILRKKSSKMWIDDLDNISDIAEKEGINNIFGKLLLASTSEEIDDLLEDKNTFSEANILFPLPSNEEQFQIVERVNNSNLVLVQGPPGTGKSHTIANLLSYFISQGKKVLVTSEKSKALEVIREKIPSEIRTLSLALLNEKGIDKDLESSINNILEKFQDKNKLSEYCREIEKLESDLNAIKIEKIENTNKIIEIMQNDTTSHKEYIGKILENQLNSYTLCDISKWLSENKAYDLINENNNEIKNVNLDAVKMFIDLDNINDELRNSKGSLIKEIEIPADLLDEQFSESISYYSNNITEINEIKEYSKSINIEALYEYDIKQIIADIKYIVDIENNFGKEWIENKSLYTPTITLLKKLLNNLDKNTQFIIDEETSFLETKVEYKLEDRKICLDSLEELNKILINKDSISKIDRLFNKKHFNRLNGIKINNDYITNIDKAELDIISNKMKYDLLIEDIIDKLNNYLEIDILNIYNIRSNQFSRNLEQIKALINMVLNYQENVEKLYNELNKIFKKDSEAHKILKNKDLSNILESLANCQKLKEYRSLEKYFSDKKSSLNNLYSDYKLNEFLELLKALENYNVEMFDTKKELLQSKITTINKYFTIKNKYEDLFDSFPSFINDYIFEFDNRTYIKANWMHIYNYYRVKLYYINVQNNSNKYDGLLKEKDRLQKNELKTVTKLVTKKGWYSQISRMDSLICSSLSKWLQLKKKLGAGTGKRASIIIRQMQEEMSIAKQAIPIWIMPVEKVIEQYPFTNEAPFDVVIMDESSQSSILSLSALMRANKMVIVGDDKQISPITVGMELNDLNQLSIKYLSDTKLGTDFSMDTSIYDIAQSACASKKVVLKEHFRCLPEIIEFSNRNYYNGQINPLKIRNKDNTIKKPILTRYIENAVVTKNLNKIINKSEVEAISDLLIEINNDETYNGKSIGIIVLQSSNPQVELIRNSVWNKLGEKFISERNLKFGTTYEFQGDERDVIILSMIVSRVTSDGEKYSFIALTTKEYERSYNVASSRAKEQMILIHSVKLEDLSQNCCRYKLLNYCTGYDSEIEKENELKFESNFEKDFYMLLSGKGFKLIPQFKVGKYRLDFVVDTEDGQKIALECDGDKFHDIDVYQQDLNRQTVLERCGWKFIRVRASEFYYDSENTIKYITEKLKDYALNGYNKTKNNKDISYEQNTPIEQEKVKTVEVIDEKIYFDEESTIKAEEEIKEDIYFDGQEHRLDLKKEPELFEDLIDENQVLITNKYEIVSKKKRTKNNIKSVKEFVEPSNADSEKYEAVMISEIIKAIADEKDVKIKYKNRFSKEGSSVIRPIRYYNSKNGYYMSAFNYKVNENRTYKLSRIEEIEIINPA